MDVVKRVLFIDLYGGDEYFLEKILENWGYDVWTIGDLRAVPAVVMGWLPHVIFLHASTPDEYGVRVTDLLRAPVWWGHIPVICYSLTDKYTGMKALAVAADAWVGPPVRLSHVNALMSRFAYLAGKKESF